MVEKIISTPRKVRGLGNIIGNKIVPINVSDEVIETEIINGVEYPVRSITFSNDNLFFTEYVNKTVVGFGESFSGVLKDDNNDVISGASVSLLVDYAVKATATSNNQGKFTFENITFTEGTHKVHLSYNNVKSERITVNCIDPDTIQVTPSDVWVTQDNTFNISAVIKDNGAVISEVPVQCISGGDILTSYTNNNGVVSFTLIGTGFERNLQITCGSNSESVNVHDGVLYMHDGATTVGKYFISSSHLNSKAGLEWLSNGFKLTPRYESVDVSSPPVAVDSNFFYKLSTFNKEAFEENNVIQVEDENYFFDDAVVEFTYRSNTGAYAFWFTAWGDYGNTPYFSFYYNVNSGNYIIDCLQSGVKVTTRTPSTLSAGDRFKLIFAEGRYVRIYKNDNLIISSWFDSHELLFGFKVNAQYTVCTYLLDDFIIQEL